MRQAVAAANTEDGRVEALDMILAAFEEGTEAGIAPEMMAYAALYAALTDLVESFGEENVAKLTQGLADRVRSGEFTLYISKQ